MAKLSVLIEKSETGNTVLCEEIFRKKVYYGWCGKFLGGNVGRLTREFAATRLM